MSKKQKTQTNANVVAVANLELTPSATGAASGVKTQGLNQAEYDRTPLEALNERQKEYIHAIDTSPVTMCTGKLGTAKTYIPTIIAADMLRDKKIERIIVARPCEGKSKSTGFFKGSKNEKLEGWCAPVTNTLKKRLGRGNYEVYLAMGKIELLALEQVKGLSLDDTFLIVDEAEDLDSPVAESLVTRMGQRSKLVIAGDIAQQDIKSYSGLQYLLDVAPYCVGLQLALIDFDSWDYNVRSEESKAWGMGFEAFKKANKK